MAKTKRNIVVNPLRRTKRETMIHIALDSGWYEPSDAEVGDPLDRFGLRWR